MLTEHFLCIRLCAKSCICIISQKNPHHPHLTDEEPELVNLRKPHKRQIWNIGLAQNFIQVFL